MTLSVFTIKTPAARRLLATSASVIADLGLAEQIAAGELTAESVDRAIAGASASISAFFNQRRDEDGNVTIARETVVETWRRETLAARSCRATPLVLGRAPATIISVTEDGVEAKRRVGNSDAAMTAGGANPAHLSSAAGPEGSPFTSAMAGQSITVAGAGNAGADLVTTIASIIDDQTVALAAPAQTTVAGAVYALDNPGYAFDCAAASGLLWKRDSAGYRAAFTASVVAVEYDAGWTVPDPANPTAAYTLPLDIESACVIYVRRKLEQQFPGDFQRILSESFPGAGSWTFALEAITWEGGLPSDVIATLKPYRRRHL